MSEHSTPAAPASRRLVVPADLAGTRVDAGLAQLMDVSRSQAATLIAEGNVSSNGKAVGKSLKLVPGAVLYVVVPERRDPLEIVEEVVEGLKILLDDDEFVVIDKPVGVAAHPSPGWVGPTVVGGAGRAGIPDLDVGRRRARRYRPPARRRDLRRHGGRQDRRRLHGPQAGLQGTHGGQGLPRRRPGPPGPAGRHDRRADRPPPRP